jgi:hypothetical protein
VRAAIPLRALAALIAVLATTVATAGCGSEAAGGGSGEARALLERAFHRQRAVKSGDLELGLKADVSGARWLRGPIELRLAGPFKSGAAGKLPSIDWDVHLAGLGQRLSGGVLATGDNAFLRFQGRSYELGRDSFATLTRRLGLARPDRRGYPRLGGIDPASWLEDPKLEDGERIGGAQTRKVTGSVDVHKAVRDLASVLDSPAVRERLRRKGLGTRPLRPPSDEDLKRIEDAIEGIHVELNVDRNDLLRRFVARIDLDARHDGEGAKGRLTFAYVLRRVGTNRVIRAPSGARPLGELFGGFGLGGLGLGHYGRRD